jgi:hypothetical protein
MYDSLLLCEWLKLMSEEKGKMIYNISDLTHVSKQVGRKTVNGPEYESTNYVKKEEHFTENSIFRR